MTKAERLKYWNKFRYIEKINSLPPEWWRMYSKTCMECKYCFEQDGTCGKEKGDFLTTSANDVSLETLKIKLWKDNEYDRERCLEFLRSPRRHDKTEEKGLDEPS